MLTERTFDAGTVSIHYAEGPSGGPPLVLLHGATLRWNNFLPVLPALSSRYHTFALDLRGHGLSSRTPGAYRNEDFAEDVVHFLRERVGEPAMLLGYSLGAGVATQVATNAPDLVRALILVEPAGYVIDHEINLDDPFFDRMRAYRELLLTHPTLEELAAGIHPLLPKLNPGQLRSRAREFSQVDPDMLTHLVEGRISTNFHPKQRLPKLTCPVLLLHGDPALGGLDAQSVERASALLPHSVRVHVPEAGHNLHIPQPLSFIQAVTDFLESL